ncbi:MAG TPA: hypothetical protein VK797_21845 [Tepidisphaeraceae bacterium]|jgi:hypothetical protein|nr:hypothetical protein [Tepidisphaeraceae bacterium]
MSDASPAILYRVHRPNGPYFAVHDPATGRLWTERSEQAARSQAQDLGLALGAVRSIRHDELMRLLGRDAAPSAEPRLRPVAGGQSTKGPQGENPDGTPRPIRSSAPFTRDQGPPVLLSKSDNAPASAFASGEPVTDEQSTTGDDERARDDVLESRGKLPKGIAKNPFADSPKHRRRS